MKNIILIGHSFGGRIASLIASKNPSWLKAIVLEAPPSLHRTYKKMTLKIALYKTIKPFVPVILRKILYSSELRDAEKRGLGKIFRNIANSDQTSFLPKIKVPTLLIWGSIDKEVPLSIAYEIKKLITKSQLVMIKGIGHNVHLENPNLFYGAIKKFIENLS